MKSNIGFKFLFVFVVSLIIGTAHSFSQSTNDSTKIDKSKSNGKGNAKREKNGAGDEEVELIRPYQPTLSDGYKISNSPQIEQTKLDIPKMTYSITSTSFPTGYDVQPINPIKMKDDKAEPLPGNLVKLGYGNYNNALADIFLNTNSNKEYTIGAHLKHFSSDGSNSSAFSGNLSNDMISVYGKRFLDNETISSELNYQRNSFHFYGVPPESDTSIHYIFRETNGHQVYNHFDANVGFQSNNIDKTKFYHDLNLKFYSISDNYNTKENGILIKGLIKQPNSKGNWVGADFLLDYSGLNQDSSKNQSNTVIGIAPQYGFKEGDLNISFGANGELENHNGTSKMHLYPKIDFNFSGDIIVLYAAVSGGVMKNTFNSLTNENHFINPNLKIDNSNDKKDGLLGIKGSLSNTISFNLSGRYSDINNMSLFGNDSIHVIPLNFNVVYDNVQVINGHAELSYQQSENIRFILNADYYHYKTSTQQFAWYKPGLDVKLTGICNIDEHFTLKADIFVLADRHGLLYSNTNEEIAVNLQTITDFNFGVVYHYTKPLSFFLNLNNISSQQYQLWYQYPVQGFNVLGGFSYAF